MTMTFAMRPALIARILPLAVAIGFTATAPQAAAWNTLDGVSTTAYFAQDFTLAEIKTLRAKERLAGRNQSYNGLYQIPTLDEVITLAKAKSIETGRTIGIYPEVKHSTFHADTFGEHAFEDQLVAQLHVAYGNTSSAPVFIQSFESSNLQYLNTQTSIKLVQLIDADDVNKDGSMSLVAPFDKLYDFAVKGDPRSFLDLLSPTGLTFVKTYADGIGPWKPYLLKTVDDGVDRTGDFVLNSRDREIIGSTGVIEDAHAAGLLVHAFTFRKDADGSSYGFANGKDEIAYYYKLGVDGLFTDFPDTGVAGRMAAAVPEPQSCGADGRRLGAGRVGDAPSQALIGANLGYEPCGSPKKTGPRAPFFAHIRIDQATLRFCRRRATPTAPSPAQPA